MSQVKKGNILVAGLALFSMFFGAGDLIWPLILGGSQGDKTLYALFGLLITGVTLPLLGLIAMMLFEGDYKAFFSRIGVRMGMILLLVIQLILGPIGSIPRLITLSFATLKPYLSFLSLPVFSVIACLVLFAFTVKKQRIVELIGLILTPCLLLTLGAILFLGFLSPPPAEVIDTMPATAFKEGLFVGYNTLDLIASFLFASLVLSHFRQGTELSQGQVLKKMFQASLIAAGLLSAMYVGLTHLASFYISHLPPHLPEERLGLIAMHLLGPKGALFSCIAVGMACLTTAIPLVAISADYIRSDLLKGRGGAYLPLLIPLILSGFMANLGFMGIARFLGPILEILCPGLIVLSILNIGYKLYELKLSKLPVYTAFGVSALGYILKTL